MTNLATLPLARGDPQPAPRPTVRSPLSGIDDEAWLKLVRALSVQDTGDVSPSGGLGRYDLRPRRLAELGILQNIRVSRRGARQVWDGDFTRGTKEQFLTSRVAQYAALARSLAEYDREYLGTLPEGVTRSGALAVLHVGGRGAYAKWRDPTARFPSTVQVFRRANGIF